MASKATRPNTGLNESLRGLVLGFPHDQLLNQGCPYFVTKRDEPEDSGETGSEFMNKRGIVLPTDDDPGTGNIAIIGPPGSAKSTLAIQFAVSCARRAENRAISAYVALETTPAEIQSKARPFQWERHFQEVRQLHPMGELASDEQLRDALLHVLTLPWSPGSLSTDSRTKCPVATRKGSPVSKACQDHKKAYEKLRLALGEKGSSALSVLEPRVLLTGLSPRSLGKAEEAESVFWTRYRQLERLLAAGSYLRMMGDRGPFRAILPLVVIDSLNMFAVRPLQREETYRLFSLFQQYNTIGVFVVESSEGMPFDSTMADVVIRLSATQDQEYFTRHIEVEKSRYRNQVYGRHPFKTISLASEADVTPRIPYKHKDGSSREDWDAPRHGVVILPSLHYAVLRSAEMQHPEQGPENGNPADRWHKPGETWGINAMTRILPRDLIAGSVIVVEGPRGSFKTNLALSFLAEGLLRDEHVMLVRLHDRSLLPTPDEAPRGDRIREWPALSTEVLKAREGASGGSSARPEGFRWEHMTPAIKKDRRLWQALVKEDKARVWPWRYPSSKGSRPLEFFEVDFKFGAVLPEEIIQVLWDIMIRQPKNHPIQRVVLADVREIGPAYPFLQSNITSGRMFLPALAHIMRHNKIDLVVTGTTGELPEADEAVGRISSVADAVVSCRFLDVFGKRFVTLQGEGLITKSRYLEEEAKGKTRQDESYVPPIVRYVEPKQFEVNPDYLEGLVGFATGNVQRPGVSVHLFQENDCVHGRYNRDLQTMLQAAFAAEPSAGSVADQAPRQSEAQSVGPASHFPASRVTVVPFDSRTSVAIHDSLHVFSKGEPIDRTVLSTVDEFSVSGLCEQANEEEKRFLPLSRGEIMPSTDEMDDEKDELIVRDRTYFTSKPDPKKAQKPPRVWPYYQNVLLLVVRRDATVGTGEKKLSVLEHMRNKKDIKPRSKTIRALGRRFEFERLMTWNGLYDAVRRIHVAGGPPSDQQESGPKEEPDAPPRIARRFWVDLSASETLSCALLDAMASGYTTHIGKKLTRKKLFGDVLKLSKARPAYRKIAREVAALYRLFQLTRPLPRDDDRNDEEQKYKKVLVDDAAVYLCWYSQLRELVDRKSGLAEKLDVLALPSGGFTGDWYIGIVKGSVSPALGRTIIKMMCAREEEYKRFGVGLGLPVRKSLLGKGHMAWPRAWEIPVGQILAMHHCALSRSDIGIYDRIRIRLCRLAWQLTPEAGPELEKDSVVKTIRKLVKGRLYPEIDSAWG